MEAGCNDISHDEYRWADEWASLTLDAAVDPQDTEMIRVNHLSYMEADVIQDRTARNIIESIKTGLPRII